MSLPKAKIIWTTKLIDDPKPTADEKKSSKTKACKLITKAGHADCIVDTGSKTTHSQLLSKATNSKLAQLKKKKPQRKEHILPKQEKSLKAILLEMKSAHQS